MLNHVPQNSCSPNSCNGDSSAKSSTAQPLQKHATCSESPRARRAPRRYNPPEIASGSAMPGSRLHSRQTINRRLRESIPQSPAPDDQHAQSPEQHTTKRHHALSRDYARVMVLYLAPELAPLPPALHPEAAVMLSAESDTTNSDGFHRKVHAHGARAKLIRKLVRNTIGPISRPPTAAGRASLRRSREARSPINRYVKRYTDEHQEVPHHGIDMHALALLFTAPPSQDDYDQDEGIDHIGDHVERVHPRMFRQWSIYVRGPSEIERAPRQIRSAR